MPSCKTGHKEGSNTKRLIQHWQAGRLLPGLWHCG